MEQAISESRLVKDALHAMQGVPAAIKHLEALAAASNSQAADKSCHSISTLWSSSLSTSSLAKLLTQLALAGCFRRRLDSFVDFFVLKQHQHGSRKWNTRNSSPNAGVGLLNQAFAAAVKTILLGHTACLDMLLDSVYTRRCSGSQDKHGGPLFGFGHVSLTLLELYLHTEELRVQLQALLKICLIDDPLAMDKTHFKVFPKGAGVLTHLYNLQLEPDPVHLELLRFLFTRTFQPYAAFIRSCIYGAALKDPYEEFIVEQRDTQETSDAEHGLRSTLKVRVGVSAPVFLAEACTELLRTGQQLEVLLKLPETQDFAQNLAKFAEPSRLEIVEEPLCDGDSSALLQPVDETASLQSSIDSEEDYREVASVSEENHDENIVGVYKGNMFLERYHRGNSWLDVGLPRNPFIFSNDDPDSYRYLYTIFSDTDLAWDIRSNIINEESLRQKLVPELAQVKGHYSLVTRTKTSCEPAVANESVATRSPSPPTSTASATSAEKIETVVSRNAQGGGAWEAYLRFPHTSTSMLSDELHMFDAGSEDIPISVIVEKYILQEILTQYRFISDFTVQLFQERLLLREHCLALRRYYFMEAGDWADNFITMLSSHSDGPSWSRYRRVEAQGMLEASLQKSSCCGDTYADRLYICEASQLELGSYHCLAAFDFVELGYHVDWPLDLVLTTQAFSMYKRVFSFLLRLRLVVFALGEISKKLQTLERALHRTRSSILPLHEKNRFRVLQLFRHQIGHFVTALQCHVQSQLLHVVWSKFSGSIQNEAKDMQDLEQLHVKYLNDALQQCFLSAELTSVKSCIDSILQCLLDFRSCLLHESNGCDDLLFTKVVDLRSSFQKHVESLHGLLKSNSQHSLPEFLMSLDYNRFFSQSYSASRS